MKVRLTDIVESLNKKIKKDYNSLINKFVDDFWNQKKENIIQ